MSYIPISENPLARIRTEAVALFQSSDLKGKDYKEIGPINDIKQIDEQTIELKIYGKVTRLNVDKDMNLNLYDENNNPLFNLKVIPEDQASNFIPAITEYPCYINIKNLGNQNYGIYYYYNNQTWEKLDFLVSNGEIVFTTPSFRKVDIEKDLYAEHIGFEGKGQLGSGRGYIWSRTFPIIISNIFIGKGQDTFITLFPQYDIYGRQAENYSQYYWSLLTDKPHSMFLQISLHSGLLSLLLILVCSFLLIIESLKKLLYKNIFNLFVFVLIGYGLSAISNDSILAITPIVIILSGVFIKGVIKEK